MCYALGWQKIYSTTPASCSSNKRRHDTTVGRELLDMKADKFVVKLRAGSLPFYLTAIP